MVSQTLGVTRVLGFFRRDCQRREGLCCLPRPHIHWRVLSKDTRSIGLPVEERKTAMASRVGESTYERQAAKKAAAMNATGRLGAEIGRHKSIFTGLMGRARDCGGLHLVEGLHPALV